MLDANQALASAWEQQRNGRLADAKIIVREVLKAHPDHPEALQYLGVILAQQQEFDEALGLLKRAVEMAEDSAVAHYNLGTALTAAGRRDDAFAEFAVAVRLEPTYVAARLNLVAAYQEAGQYEQALHEYEQVIALEPLASDAHYNRGLVLLKLGRWEEGWSEYEWRQRLPDYPVQRVALPPWDGAALVDKTLLVHAEQGMGDTIQFIRYLPLVKERAPQASFAVQPALVPLLETSGYQGIEAAQGEIKACDFQISLLSLPGVLKTTEDTIPGPEGYLNADVARTERWKERIESLPGMRIGIAWQGSPTHAYDRWRSIPLSAFATLAALKDVTLVSLQKPQPDEAAREAPPFALHELGDDWDRDAAFVDTAAVLKHLHLLVTADTAVAHLAGALGVPVWVALSTVSDWRWMLAREDSPWYASMRLFRQRAEGEWDEVFARMAAVLKKDRKKLAPTPPKRSSRKKD